MKESILIRGTKSDLDIIYQELSGEFAGDSIIIHAPAPVPRNLLDRTALRQHEVMLMVIEVAVDIAKTIAGRAIYDVLKARLEEKAKERSVKIEIPPRNDKDNSSPGPKW